MGLAGFRYPSYLTRPSMFFLVSRRKATLSMPSTRSVRGTATEVSSRDEAAQRLGEVAILNGLAVSGI